MPAAIHLLKWFALSGLACLCFCVSVFANPPLPAIPANVFYVTNYGAVGNGTTDNTVAISNTIAAASLAGGGTVEITAAAGNYMCGPLNLKSSINFQVDAGATLQMFPIASWPGTTTFINGASLHDVEISGSGTIDGNAQFGTNQWWGIPGNTNAPLAASRPNFINFTGTTRLLIQNVTMQNPPTFHMMLKGNNANITIQGITINTPGTSPNTDGMDLGSTNMLIQNCYISDGDDNIEIGGNSAKCWFITVTNCTFGTGHGVSVGSDIGAGVSNVTVVNCSFTGTVNGIRLKSDNDRGGVVQNCSYYNITMTNVQIPLQIYSYYDTVGTPTSITPQIAASETVASVLATTPTWRNILISNLTVVSASKIGGIIWSRTELPASNITLVDINMSAPKTFDIYNARGVTIVDSQFNFGSGPTYTCYNSQVTITNSSPAGAPLVTLDGLTTNSTSNVFKFYNASGSLTNTNLLDTLPALTLGGGTLTVSNNLSLQSSSVLNFVLGANAATIAVKTNLTLGGTLNISAGSGFTNGSYTLFTYGGTLTSNATTLGTLPAGYNYSLNTSTPGQVILTAANPISLTPVTLSSQVTNGILKLMWPFDHTGWHLEIQTNSVNTGLSTNWSTLGGSSTTNQVLLPISTNNGAVFVRLKYP